VTGALEGIRVLDMSRILAGPTAAQLLGDLGAEVLKIERPGHGDDTRRWGPPFVKDARGEDTTESAYYLCANRNKRSVAIDFTTAEGAALIRELAARSDVLLENYKVGGLAKHGLDHASLELPSLIYVSISGFGQTGPRKDQPGYDFLIQAMGGIMSLTGPVEGPPTKVGVGIADVMCGMYATVATLAALRSRERTGRGQHVDVALFDAQVAWLINAATNYLTSGEAPRRFGNAHPNIVPYQVFETADGSIAIACGNDAQIERLCAVLGVPELPEDPRFVDNAARLANRDVFVATIEERTRTKPSAHWEKSLQAVRVPVGPVRTLPEVFDDPQTKHREMRVTMEHPLGGEVSLLGNPLKLSETPVTYRRPPPLRGEHTDEVLRELGKDDAEIARLREAGVIE